MLTTNIQYITTVIDNSRLIKAEHKDELKKRLNALTTEKLEEVRSHLESESAIIKETLQKAVKNEIESNPKSSLPEKLNNFFRKSRFGLVHAQESEARKAEEEELRSIEKSLEEKPSPPKPKSHWFLITVVSLLAITAILGAIWYFTGDLETTDSGNSIQRIGDVAP